VFPKFMALSQQIIFPLPFCFNFNYFWSRG
jgi:hypothetical protein